MPMNADPAAFFEQLLPAIEENVRENDMLIPALVVHWMNGRCLPVSVRRFFDKDHPERKDVLLPVIEMLFTNPNVAMVALIAECWMKVFSKETEEDFRRQVDEAGGVEGVEGRTEGVMVSVYTRGSGVRDVNFMLEIKSGRTGVRRGAVWDNTQTKGRFARKNPEEN